MASYPDPAPRASASLVDVLDRVLDKGLVVVGDIRVSLADVELLTIRIRLLVCSIDKAQEIGLDWWKYDPELALGTADPRTREPGAHELSSENETLRERVRLLEEKLETFTLRPPGSAGKTRKASASRRTASRKSKSKRD